MTRSLFMPSLRFVALCLAAALASLLPHKSALAQAPPPRDPARAAVGMDVFRKTLQILQFRPVKSFADLDPKDCVLVILGDTRRLTDVPGGLTPFLEQGGAALIASDEPMRPAPKAALVDATGFAIAGYKWSASPDRTQCYKQIDFCPYLRSDDPRFMRDPKTRQPLQPVATNVPSVLTWEKNQPGVTPCAVLPPETKVEHPVDLELFNILGAAGDVGKGRVLVLADHSIFINEMMRPRDTGNVEFTANCLMYLRGEQNQRQRVLFVDDGVIQHSFETGTPKPSPADLASVLLGALLKRAAEKAKQSNTYLNRAQDKLNDIDEADGFNRPVAKFVAGHPERWRRFVVMLLVFATLGLLIYGCYRLGIASRYRSEPAVPSLARAALHQAPRGGLLQLRHEGLLDAANVWETGRQLARDAFEAGGVAAPVPYHEPAVQLPQVGWWRRARVRQRILQLWRLAFLNRPTPLAPQALRSLAVELERLKADLKRGTIRIA